MPGQFPTTTTDRWQTTQIILGGGILDNSDELSLARKNPGSLVEGINYEPGLRGGYRRINGYSKFVTIAVPGTGPILGICVFPDFGVVAARNDKIYFSTGGSTWTRIDGGGRSTPTKVRFTYFNYSANKIFIVDGVNNSATYDGTTYTEIASAPKGTIASSYANYMFVALNNLLYFSAPADETDWNGADGSGVLNLGFNITGLRVWRGSIYIFGTNQISALHGTIFGGVSPDSDLSPVATNVGCISPDSIVEVNGDVLFLSSDGIRPISGTTKIGDVELATITDPVHSPFLEFIKAYTFSNFCACAVRSKNQYRIFASNTGTNTAASVGWLAGIRNSSMSYTGPASNWEFFKLQGINCACVDSGYVSEVEYVVHGGFDGFVYKQETGNSFDGGVISSMLRLPYNGFDDPELRKTFYKLKTNILAEGTADVSAQLSFDFGVSSSAQPSPFIISLAGGNAYYYGSAVYGGSYYASASSPDYFNYAIGSGLNMGLVFSSSDASSYPFTIRSAVLDYQINGRR